MFKGKKALTPIIAVILLLMMTVAAAGGAFFWFIRIQSELQGGAEVYSEDLQQKLSARVEIVAITNTDLVYGTHGVNNNLSLYLSNIGSKPIPLSTSTSGATTTLTISDDEQNIICQHGLGHRDTNCTSGCGGDLNVRETKEIAIHLNNTCNINETNYANETLFYINIDFSGITATGSSFRR